MKTRRASDYGDENSEWTTIIQSRSGLLDFHLRELLHYKFLMFLFVRRDFVSQFKQTILGPAWFLIQPLFTTGIYSLIFGSLAKIPTDGVPQPVFYMAGTTLWNYFSGCAGSTGTIFTGNAYLFGKVYFPRLTVPLTQIMSKLYVFLIQMVLFLIVYFVYMARGANMHPTIWLILLPLYIAHAGLLGLAIGLWSSALTVKYRDLGQLISFGMSLLMWATPIVYPLSLVPQKYRVFMFINPMSAVVEAFRNAFTGAGPFPVLAYFLSAGVTAVLLFLGLLLFHRAEDNFVDVA